MISYLCFVIVLRIIGLCMILLKKVCRALISSDEFKASSELEKPEENKNHFFISFCIFCCFILLGILFICVFWLQRMVNFEFL